MHCDSSSPSQIEEKCGCADWDEWMDIRVMYLIIPDLQPDFVWVKMIPEATSEWMSGIMTSTDNIGFVDYNVKD